MSLFVILLGGDLVPTPRLRQQIADSRFVAADSGIRHAEKLGVEPEIWVGDFDSSDPADYARHAGVPRKAYPAGKDVSDGEIAIEEALARGASQLVLAGAFGGPRADHAHLHLVIAMALAERGIPVTLTSGTQEGWPLLPGTRVFDLPFGTLFSVSPFGDLEGLSITGAAWPLENVRLPFGSSLTLSNRVDGRLVIGLAAGRALLIAHPHAGPERVA